MWGTERFPVEGKSGRKGGLPCNAKTRKRAGKKKRQVIISRPEKGGKVCNGERATKQRLGGGRERAGETAY